MSVMVSVEVPLMVIVVELGPAGRAVFPFQVCPASSQTETI